MANQRIEDVINSTLQGDARENALDFIAFLHASEIPFNVSGNYLDAHYQGKNVCSILITGTDQAPGPWTIWSDQEPGTWITWSDDDETNAGKDFAVDKHTQEIIWAHVNPCASCGGKCSPGKTKTVLGRTFPGLCSSAVAFTDPDAEALACAKQMVTARKDDIRKAASAAGTPPS